MILRHFKSTFNLLVNSDFNTWDIQWVYSCIMQNSLCVNPEANLVTNIGHDGAHSSGKTISHDLRYGTVKKLDFAFKNEFMAVNSEYDLKLHRLFNFPELRRLEIIKWTKYFKLYGLLRKLYKFFCD